MLPDELLLEILQYVGPLDLWMSARLCSRQMKHCIEELFSRNIIKSTKATLVYSLGSGAQHRWYDVRATVTFTFQQHHQSDTDLVIFDVSTVAPLAYRERALRKWQNMTTEDLSPTKLIVELDWHVELMNDMFHVPLYVQRLSDGGGTAILINWRHLFARFFKEARQSTAHYAGTSTLASGFRPYEGARLAVGHSSLAATSISTRDGE